MSETAKSREELLRENEELRRRLDEPEAVIRAISGGEVDAFLVRPDGGDEQVFVLAGVDRPYRLLIERMRQGAATVTRDGVILYANRRFGEMLGVSAAQLLGSSLVSHVAKEDRGALELLIRNASPAGFEHEIALEHRQRRMATLVSVSPLDAASGLLCVMVTDLTQQKQQELARERLAQEEASRAAAERTNAALREMDRRKDEFLAMLAHELRNPLAPLRNGMSILNLIGGKDDEVQRVQDIMTRQIDDMVRLIDDLLDLSRITQGKMQLQTRAVDLATVVTQAVESCRPAADERRQQLSLAVPRAPLPVLVDAGRVRQVVAILVGNASKFTMAAGEIRVTVESGSHAVLRVADNGIGIAPEMLPRVFDLFMQSEPSGHRNAGLGLGLALSRRLVELHGGEILASSPGVGLGSEFTVKLPRYDGGLEPAQVGTGRRTLCVQRILIVDDNRDAAESLAKLLQLQGHQVVAATGGLEAIGVIAEFVPTLVFLDIGMPGMNGFEVHSTMRRSLAGRDVQFIALTGYATENDRRLSREAGFDHHLAKPVTLAAIEAIIAARSRNR